VPASGLGVEKSCFAFPIVYAIAGVVLFSRARRVVSAFGACRLRGALAMFPFGQLNDRSFPLF
jgi:hypothetical protein